MHAAVESDDDSSFESLIMEGDCSEDVSNPWSNELIDVSDLWDIGWRPLHVAAFRGHLSVVERLLQRDDIEIDWRSFEGKTALWLAADEGHQQVCRCLLQNGAQPNIANNENESPLHVALSQNHLDCARVLVEFGANVNAVDFECRTPILDAALLGNTEMVTLLIESGANVDVADVSGYTSLFMAAQCGNMECFRLIHEQRCKVGNANVNDVVEGGLTPLMAAAFRGWLDCVRYLLDKGADANHADARGEVALHYAIRSRNIGCEKALMPRTSRYALLKGCYGSQVTADPDWLPAFVDRVRSNGAFELPKDGVSVIHLAVAYNRLELLEHLIQGGIHPDHYICTIQPQISHRIDGCEKLYHTALGLACHKGNETLATVLLDHGAQFTLGNDLVCDPFLCALTEACPSGFIRFLVERGADINSSHMKVDGDLPPAVILAFKQPRLLREVLLLGGRLKNWDPEVRGGVGHLFMEMYRNVWNFYDLLEVLSVAVHFAPLHQFRPLYSTLKSYCQPNSVRSRVHFTNLDQIVASPQSLLQLCRLKIREALMMRRGSHLEYGVSTLTLPPRLREYLMFR